MILYLSFYSFNLCACVQLCACEYSAKGRQKKVLDALELELKTTVSAKTRTHVPYKSSC